MIDQKLKLYEFLTSVLRVHDGRCLDDEQDLGVVAQDLSDRLLGQYVMLHRRSTKIEIQDCDFDSQNRVLIGNVGEM